MTGDSLDLLVTTAHLLLFAADNAGCRPAACVPCRQVLPLVSVALCGNNTGSRAACRRHLGRMLHIIAQGTNNVIQECCNLGELAIWLGVGKVGVSLSNSHAGQSSSDSW